MNLFMPAERVLYDRAYYLSDEAEKDYAFEVAEEHGVDVGEVLYSDELMKEVRDALDRDIDLYLDDEIANFDSMLRELKCGDDPEHPAEISVPVNGLHFYHGDEPKPAPEFFKPAKVKGGKSPAAIAAAAKVAAGNSAPGTDYREHGIQRDRRAVQ